MTQIREVQGNTGFRSQNALTVHFGLGASTNVDRIHIRWPSGVEQDTALAVVDHRLRVVERTSRLGVSPGGVVGSSAVSFAAPAPNPATGRARLDYFLPAPARVRLAIVDAQGRAVRMLEAGVLGAGPHAADWDGRDAAGARVPGGIYWCVLDAAGTRISRRVAIVR